MQTHTHMCTQASIKVSYTRVFLTHVCFHVHALTYAWLTIYTCTHACTLLMHTNTRPPPMQVPLAPYRPGCCRRSLSRSARLKMTITLGAQQSPQETQVPLLRDTQRSKGPNYLLLFWQLSGRE